MESEEEVRLPAEFARLSFRFKNSAIMTPMSHNFCLIDDHFPTCRVNIFPRFFPLIFFEDLNAKKYGIARNSILCTRATRRLRATKFVYFEGVYLLHPLIVNSLIVNSQVAVS